VERALNNRILGGHFHNLDLSIHTTAHLVRAVVEDIAISNKYNVQQRAIADC